MIRGLDRSFRSPTREKYLGNNLSSPHEAYDASTGGLCYHRYVLMRAVVVVAATGVGVFPGTPISFEIST